MFALVKFRDGVKQIVPASDIKSFDSSKVSYTKKYKIKWEDGQHYEAVIILVGETRKEVEDKGSAKRPRVTPFDLCESADDTDASVAEETKDKCDNSDKEKLKEIVEKKILKAQTNLNKFVTTCGKKNDSRSTARTSNQVQKTSKEIKSTSSANGAIKKKPTQSQDQLKIISTVKILEPGIGKPPDKINNAKFDDGKLENYKDSATTKLKNITKRNAAFKVPSEVKPVIIKPIDPLARKKAIDDTSLTNLGDFKVAKVKGNTERSTLSVVPSSTSNVTIQTREDGKKIPMTTKLASQSTGVVQKLHDTEINNHDENSNNYKALPASTSTSHCSPGTALGQPSNVHKKNVSCGSCKKMEKKVNEVNGEMKKLEIKMQNATIKSKESDKEVHDVIGDMKKLEGLNNQLKQALKDKDKMLTEATRLNIDLQSKVLDEFDELKIIIADMKQRARENLEKNQGVLPVGYKRLDKNMIHLGQDVWITIPQYDSISALSDTAAKFVKNIAIAVYGTPTLKASSVTGNVSNRLRNKNKDLVARPKLDPTRLLAIKDILGFWLKTEKNLDEVSIDIETVRVGTHISHKIFELLRKDKKSEASYNTDIVPEVTIEEEELPADEESFNGVENDRQEIGGGDDDQETESGDESREPEERDHAEESGGDHDDSESDGSSNGRANKAFLDDQESHY